MRTRTAATLTAMLATAVVGSATLVAAPTAEAATRLACTARVNTAHPRQYTTVYVYVHTAASAAVTTAAHYKTTTNVKHARANSTGNATIGYYISGATKGRTVPVTVSVIKGAARGSCSTYFIPR